MKDVRPAMKLPRGLRLTKSEMTGRIHSKLPVDPKLPELENRMGMSMTMEIRDQRNGGILRRSVRIETHAKIEPLKPGR